jgi:hypothetical protein
MPSKSSIKLNASLCERAKIAAARLGYSSVEEFIEHAVEKQLASLEEAGTKEDVALKLKGLGYLD